MKHKVLLYKELLQWYYYNGVVNSFTTLDQKLDKASDAVQMDSLGNNKNTTSIKLDREKPHNDLDKVRSLEDLKQLTILDCDCALKKTAKNPSISKKKSPYGDGNSAKKIIKHLKNNL